MIARFACDCCTSTGVIVRACEHGGWKVTCTNGHEAFPWTGTTIVVDPRRDSRPAKRRVV